MISVVYYVKAEAKGLVEFIELKELFCYLCLAVAVVSLLHKRLLVQII